MRSTMPRMGFLATWMERPGGSAATWVAGVGERWRASGSPSTSWGWAATAALSPMLIWPPLAAPALSPNNGRDPLPVGRAEARAPPRAAGRAAGRGRPARRMGRPLVRRSRRSRPARVANGHAGAELSVSWRPNYGAQPVSGGSPTFALQPRCPDYGAQPVSAWETSCWWVESPAPCMQDEENHGVCVLKSSWNY